MRAYIGTYTYIYMFYIFDILFMYFCIKVNQENRLCNTDAKVVDVIHTVRYLHNTYCVSFSTLLIILDLFPRTDMTPYLTLAIGSPL